MRGIFLIIIGIILFELIIFFHELGHFIAAKKSGVKVNEFALGMGPKIFSFKKGETLYSLRIFPIGGFCAMEGEDEESDNPRSFNSVKVWKRMIIVVSGALMNFLFGLLLMSIILAQQPSFAGTVIEDFPETSYTANSGLKAGDKLLKVNGYKIKTDKDISFGLVASPLKEVDGGNISVYKQDVCIKLTRLYVSVTEDNKLDENNVELLKKSLDNGVKKVNKAENKEEVDKLYASYYSEINEIAKIKDYEIPVIEKKDKRQRYLADIEVERNGEVKTLKDVQLYTYLELDEEGNPKEDKPALAIDFYVNSIEKTPVTLISQTFQQTGSMIKTVWNSLVGMVQGKFSFQDIAGPIGTASIITKVASEGLKTSFVEGLNNVIFFIMFISVNLGVVNLLPFPALDGGRFVFLLIEAIRGGKPIPRKYEAYVNGIGLILLFGVMILVTIKDVWQLIGG